MYKIFLIEKLMFLQRLKENVILCRDISKTFDEKPPHWRLEATPIDRNAVQLQVRQKNAVCSMFPSIKGCEWSG
jgi:hypothetical protein